MADAVLRGMPNVPVPPRPVSEEDVEKNHRADLVRYRKRLDNKYVYGAETPNDAQVLWRLIVRVCGAVLLFGPILLLLFLLFR